MAMNNCRARHTQTSLDPGLAWKTGQHIWGGRGGGNNTVKKLWKNTKVAPRQHKSLAVVISHCSNNEGQWLLAQTTPTPG